MHSSTFVHFSDLRGRFGLSLSLALVRAREDDTRGSGASAKDGERARFGVVSGAHAPAVYLPLASLVPWVGSKDGH
jgi:hypothetical protein